MYGINLSRVIAHDIAKKHRDLYSLNNMPGCLTNVPFNYYFKDTKLFAKYCKQSLLIDNPKATLQIINDGYLEASILGGYLEVADNYIIIINANANPYWQRFALIKELSSLYINHYARKHLEMSLQTYDNYEESLESSYHQKIRIKSKGLDKDDLDSDTFAIFLASELMIPPMYRKHTDKLLARVQKGQMAMNDVAQSLAMPEYMLQKMVDHGYYQDSCAYYTDQNSQSGQ